MTPVQKSLGSSTKNPDVVVWTEVREDPSLETVTRTRRTATLDGAGPQQSHQNQDLTRKKILSLVTT